jgi:hypothetical protein
MLDVGERPRRLRSDWIACLTFYNPTGGVTDLHYQADDFAADNRTFSSYDAGCAI